MSTGDIDLPDAFAAEKNREFSPIRFGEPAKFLPVVFVCTIIVMLWCIYMVYHCFPMLLNPSTAYTGMAQTLVFNYVSLMLMICYLRSCFTHPGTIPDKEVGTQSPWDYVAPDAHHVATDSLTGQQQDTKETKRSGDKRYCKWCAKYKPDRCHHCRVCRTCILRMDHHCPWIYNCVGFCNHKYFFLLLLYSCAACNIIIWTMYPSLKAAVNPNAPFLKMFALLFGETLACFLGFMVTVFLGFHMWLTQKAMTTIEFCEKSMKRTGYDSSSFNRGLYGNIRCVLGENPALWLFPCSPPSGDGLSYLNEEAPLLRTAPRDVEAGRELRKKTHESTPQRRVAGTGGSAAGTGEWESDSSPEPDPSTSPPLSTPVIRQYSDPRAGLGQTGQTNLSRMD